VVNCQRTTDAKDIKRFMTGGSGGGWILSQRNHQKINLDFTILSSEPKPNRLRIPLLLATYVERGSVTQRSRLERFRQIMSIRV